MQKDSTSYLKSLLPDTDKIKKKLKTYRDLPAEKYSHILARIEYSIASYYIENPYVLTDKKVLAVLESLLAGPSVHPTGSSKITKKSKKAKPAMPNPALKSLVNDAAIEALTKKPVTQHEFDMCIKFIMYSIDNRSWVPTGTGYLDWIANMFDLLPEEKKAEFDAFYDMISQMFGFKAGVLTMDDKDNEHS